MIVQGGGNEGLEYAALSILLLREEDHFKGKGGMGEEWRKTVKHKERKEKVPPCSRGPEELIKRVKKKGKEERKGISPWGRRIELRDRAWLGKIGAGRPRRRNTSGWGKGGGRRDTSFKKV